MLKKIVFIFYFFFPSVFTGIITNHTKMMTSFELLFSKKLQEKYLQVSGNFNFLKIYLGQGIGFLMPLKAISGYRKILQTNNKSF